MYVERIWKFVKKKVAYNKYYEEFAVFRKKFLHRLNNLGKFEDELETFEEKNKEFLLMDRAMQHLGEPCKSLLESYYLQKRSMVEIATDFGYTNADNAKNQKYKCLMRLKKMFFEQYKK